MNIKEKFKDIIDFTEISGSCDIIEKCENISDNYAIEFGRWILRNFNNYGPNDEKELLQIFKQQLYNN